MSKNIFFRLDWLSIFIFLLLVSFGILSIYSTTFSEIQMSIFNWSAPAGKQFLIFMFWICGRFHVLIVQFPTTSSISNVQLVVPTVRGAVSIFIFWLSFLEIDRFKIENWKVLKNEKLKIEVGNRTLQIGRWSPRDHSRRRHRRPEDPSERAKPASSRRQRVSLG